MVIGDSSLFPFVESGSSHGHSCASFDFSFFLTWTRKWEKRKEKREKRVERGEREEREIATRKDPIMSSYFIYLLINLNLIHRN
jgi:hypothetical protein